MKNFKILIYSFITLITVTSCDDKELDLAPISQLTTGNFYQTSIQIDQALTGAFAELNPLYDDMMIRAAIWRGDNSSQTNGYANNLELNISQFNENAGSQVSTDIWNTCYSIINRVNLVIQKSEGVEDYAQKAKFPEHIINELADIGAFGPYIPEKYGGPGLDHISYGLLMQEIERGDSGIRSTASVQSSLVMYPISVSYTHLTLPTKA